MIPAVDAASLIGWWHGAGIDTLVDDVPTPWLGRNIAAKPAIQPQSYAATAQAQPEHVELVEAQLPLSLPALIDYINTTSVLDAAGPVTRRIATSGNHRAPLMIMVDMPEAQDHETGQLISGECARLFENMLKAIGLDRSSTYIAAFCPSRPVTGMINETLALQLGTVARHHIGLVAPKRLWLLGDTVSRAILGVGDRVKPGNLHIFNHETAKVTTMASIALRFLLQNPSHKAAVWADMQTMIKGI